MLHQLSFLKESIKSSVNDFLGIDYIIDIQYKVRKRNIEDIFENEGEEEEFDPKKIKLDNKIYINVKNPLFTHLDLL